MALLACGQLQRFGQFAGPDPLARVEHHLVIQPRTAFGDQAFGILAGGGKASAHEQLRHRDARGKLAGREGQGRQIIADTAHLKHRARGSLGRSRSLRPVQQAGHQISEADLGYVDL